MDTTIAFVLILRPVVRSVIWMLLAYMSITGIPVVGTPFIDEGGVAPSTPFFEMMVLCRGLIMGVAQLSLLLVSQREQFESSPRTYLIEATLHAGMKTSCIFLAYTLASLFDTYLGFVGDSFTLRRRTTSCLN